MLTIFSSELTCPLRHLLGAWSDITRGLTIVFFEATVFKDLKITLKSGILKQKTLKTCGGCIN